MSRLSSKSVTDIPSGRTITLEEFTSIKGARVVDFQENLREFRNLVRNVVLEACKVCISRTSPWTSRSQRPDESHTGVTCRGGVNCQNICCNKKIRYDRSCVDLDVFIKKWQKARIWSILNRRQALHTSELARVNQ